MELKKVLITGILGQDGANMAEYLLKELDLELEVFGMMRRTSNANFGNIKSFKEHPRFHLVCGDLTDEISIKKRSETFTKMSVSQMLPGCAAMIVLAQ